MISERTINGDEESVFQGMQGFVDEYVDAIDELAEPAMEQAVLYLHGRVPAYPPPLPNQKYRRTGTLGRRITTSVERLPDGVAGQIGAGAPYSPWVIGPQYPGEMINGRMMYQARIHEGRWWRFYDVMNASADEAWAVFDEELFRLVSERLAGSA